MSGLNRRDFLKALGLGGSATVISACGFDQNYYRSPIEEVLPYVVRPEQVIPGNPTFFATTVTMGPAAYPLLARHRDGRVINVGVNPRANFTDPGIPTAAFLELQRHYSPDRYKGPLIDHKPVEDETTDGKVSRSKWDLALETFASAIRDSRAKGKKVAYLGPLRSGAIVELIRSFTDGEAVFWEPLAPEAELIAAEKLFGARVLPAYDLSKARYILSFGAEFLGAWGTVATHGQFAKARNPNGKEYIARFALVSPHRGQTGANADDWFAAASGSEASVALAIAKLLDEKLGGMGAADPVIGPILAKASVDGALQASGLALTQLEGIAQQLVAAAGSGVVLPGGVTGSSKSATELAIATYILNIVAGHRGRTFGFGPVYAGPIDGFARVEQLIHDINDGKIGVLLVDDHCNPAYSLPEDAGFTSAISKLDALVSLSSHPDETNASAKIILPTSDVFEDWGDEEPATGLHLLRQPSMTPLQQLGYEPRSLGDILLVTARASGLGKTPTPEAGTESTSIDPFAAKTWRVYLQAAWQTRIYPATQLLQTTTGVTVDATHDFDRWWEKSLGEGFVDLRPVLEGPSTLLPVEVDFAATPAEGHGEFTLLAIPHAFIQDGRYANQPWAQEVADPMTGIVWDSWLEIHPKTAERLGIGVGSQSTVELDVGGKKLTVGAVPYRGIREDSIAIQFGQGHTANGRYADNIGVNVIKALTSAKGRLGALAWQQAKVGARVIGHSDLVSTFGNDQMKHIASIANERNIAWLGGDFKRGIGVVVSAESLITARGDAPNETPGHLTGLVYPQLDKRLTSKGITDLYPIPDHPTYRFGMTVDVNACNGCGVCAIACYAENNLSVVGKLKMAEGREMAWLRVNRYWGEDTEGGVQDVRFVPMMCQHCGHAPCESVCPVLATYHTIDGLNAMIYNRCVGTRYCANNCPYGARRFNWHSYVWPEPFNFQLNPDIVARTMGIMEKCTFCVQRIRSVKSAWKEAAGFTAVVPDEQLRMLPACAEACPSQALVFGNLNDAQSTPAQTRSSARHYEVFADQNTFPAINYLAKASFHPPVIHHGSGHGAAHDENHKPDEGHGNTEHGEGHGTKSETPVEHH